jgi:hypothetical protein
MWRTWLLGSRTGDVAYSTVANSRRERGPCVFLETGGAQTWTVPPGSPSTVVAGPPVDWFAPYGWRVTGTEHGMEAWDSYRYGQGQSNSG